MDARPRPRAGPSLDPAQYPHIWDLVLDHLAAATSYTPREEENATYQALLDTCTALREALRARLYAHVAVHARGGILLPFFEICDEYEDGEVQIPGLDWLGGADARALCVRRLARYCRVVDDVFSDEDGDPDGEQRAAMARAVAHATTVRVLKADGDAFDWASVTTVLGFSTFDEGTIDLYNYEEISGLGEEHRAFSDGSSWYNSTTGYTGPPVDRGEHAVWALWPVRVPLSTRVIVYCVDMRTMEWDHGNSSFAVGTELARLPHLTDLVFAFDMFEYIDHRPNNHKPLGVLHSLVKSVAGAVPRARLTFVALDVFPRGWYCDASIPDAGGAAWEEYMRRYIARFLLWCNAAPGRPGETYFRWARRTADDVDTEEALAPYLAAVAVQSKNSEKKTLLGSHELYRLATDRLSYEDGPGRGGDEADGVDWELATLEDHGDADYDGGYGYGMEGGGEGDSEDGA
ncbi:hypothetical protein Q8F55_003563 [Vanrija albida]|uniref:Uncharacterized protein n=1 Tax=Vanrija albida TaxID=181172 RepID=A0ABR3Q4H9_9TREE